MTLPAASEKATVVEDMFDRISGRYDFMNRLMTFGLDRAWRRQAVDSLHLRRGHVVLDLACGTGDLCAEVAGRGARVIGVDFSAGMLGCARRREFDVELVRADALELPLGEASCDAVVSGFALRNFTDLGATLAESFRVLRPRGRIALLEVDTPASAVLRMGHGLYFNKIVPVLGRMLSDGVAYRYLPSSVAYLPDEEGMRALLGGIGFTGLAKHSFLGGAAQLLTASRPQ